MNRRSYRKALKDIDAEIVIITDQAERLRQLQMRERDVDIIANTRPRPGALGSPRQTAPKRVDGPQNLTASQGPLWGSKSGAADA